MDAAIKIDSQLDVRMPCDDATKAPCDDDAHNCPFLFLLSQDIIDHKTRLNTGFAYSATLASSPDKLTLFR